MPTHHHQTRAPLCGLVLGVLVATGAACGGSDAQTLVIDAVVTARCVEGGDCSEAPAKVSVGHCGDGAFYDEDAGVARIVSDLPPEDVAVVVAVRHDEGEQPDEAPNGGTTRGFVVERGGRAEVVGLLRPEVVLYVVDDAAQILEVDTTALRAQEDGRLVFAYRVGDLDVEEVHTTVLAEPRPVDQIGSDHLLASCCAAVDRTSVALWTLTALALPLRRRRRQASIR